MDFPIGIAVFLMISFYWLLQRDFHTVCTYPYISRSIHYGNGVAQHLTKTETHPYWIATTYFALSHSIPTSSRHTVADVGLLSHKAPYHSFIIQPRCCWYGIAMGHKTPYHSYIIQAYCGWYGIAISHEALYHSYVIQTYWHLM